MNVIHVSMFGVEYFENGYVFDDWFRDGTNAMT